MEGFQYLGAEEKKDFDYVSLLKKTAPNVISAVTEELEKKEGKPSSDKTLMKSKSSGSWLTKKVVGPIPGWGVLLLGGGVLTGVGLLIRKMVSR